MINDVKKELAYNYDLILKVFNDVFVRHKYKEESLSYNNLLNEESLFPLSPNIVTSWINEDYKKKIHITFFVNYVFDITIVDIERKESIYLYQYCKNKFKKDVGVYYMNEDTIEKKFIAYLGFIKEVILTDFSEVIAGDKWISIPFDWQGQK